MKAISTNLKKASQYLTLLACLFFIPELTRAQKHKDKPDKNDVSYLADSSVLNRSDYLASLGKVYEAINQVRVTTGSFYKLNSIKPHLEQDEAAISLLRDRLNQKDRPQNLQNLQMYQTLLSELDSHNQTCLEDLKEYDEELNEVKTHLLELGKDTVLTRLFSTDSLKVVFKSQFTELAGKKTEMDSLIKTNTSILNALMARTSTNLINIKELKFLTENQLKLVGVKAFGKERRYLWETINQKMNRKIGFKHFLESEKKISFYYFVYTRNTRLLLFLTGAVFFFWVYYNFKTLKKADKMDVTTIYGFNLLRPKPYQITFILILTLAPVFDLLAPALYIEGVYVLLAILLASLLYKRVPKKVFYTWAIFVVLLLLPILLRLLGFQARSQRWILLIFSILSTIYGIKAFQNLRPAAGKFSILLPVGIIYILFNILAIFCNIFGRFTLTQIFYNTAISAVLNSISLILLASMLTEAFILQVKTSRIRRNYADYFDWQRVERRVGGILGIVIFVIWTTLFLTNLNIFNELYNFVLGLLNEKRTIGSLTFTLGGIVLFLVIIWAANFLQKYITYFFGDMGDDSLEENKSERSKLIIMRLVLLIGGFLVAVAASGLPIDKITVVLGALGVGIGLGLQNIVSNFVSGIILIFDKTLRIGDMVELGDKKGRVKEIGIRASTLLTDDGAEIIIPNGSILSNNIINWTLTNNQMRAMLEFTISKPYDREVVSTLILEVIKNSDNIFLNKEPKLIISPKSKSSSQVRVYFWCMDISMAEPTKSSIMASIFDEFDDKGIEVLS